MKYNHYKSYSAADYILDEKFIDMVKGQSPDGCTIGELKKELPEKNKEISLAIEILKELKTKKTEINNYKKEELLSGILNAKKQFRIKIFKYAASVLLVAGIGASALLVMNIPSEIENFASSTTVQSANAELILADGKRIEIDSKQSKIEYVANSASVSLNDSAKVEQSLSVAESSFNQIIIPFGKRSNVLLSDGTRVWLNSGSRMVYPPVFTGKKREIFLEGEAYLEVSENKSQPFYVRTDAFKIKVLGTRFVVQAYKNEAEHNTILVQGKVSLTTNSKIFAKAYELSPNQKATLSNTKDEFSITTVDNATDYFEWIYGYLHFERENIVSLSQKIAKYYNIQIEVNSRNMTSRFSGKLDLKDSPERILNGLATIFKTKYEKRGEKFVFYD